MDGKHERHTGTLQTIYEDDEEFNCNSAETPTVEATPRVTQWPRPYQREIERLTRQLIEREHQVKQQEELLLQYATPVKPSVTDPTLTPRVPRPQDIAYLERLRRQKEQEVTMKTTSPDANNPDMILSILQKLTSIVVDTRTATDVSEPPKFSGRTEDWDTWYQQFRTYLKAKGWLETFLHPHGPGTDRKSVV